MRRRPGRRQTECLPEVEQFDRKAAQELPELPAPQAADVLVDLEETQRLTGLWDLGGLAAVQGLAVIRLVGDPRAGDERLGDIGILRLAPARRWVASIAVPDAFEPRLLPEDQAGGLASVVGRAVTSDSLEMDRIAHPPHDACSGARRIGTPRDRQRAPAVLEHLRHERKAIERSARIQSGEDLRGAANADLFTWSQVEDRRSVAADLLECRRFHADLPNGRSVASRLPKERAELEFVECQAALTHSALRRLAAPGRRSAERGTHTPSSELRYHEVPELGAQHDSRIRPHEVCQTHRRLAPGQPRGALDKKLELSERAEPFRAPGLQRGMVEEVHALLEDGLRVHPIRARAHRTSLRVGPRCSE